MTAVDRTDYDQLLETVTSHLDEGRHGALAALAGERLRTYHAIGRTIVARQAAEGGGAGVIDRLSADLRARYPGQSGLGPRNLRYMRRLALAWPEVDGATPVAQLPWGHVTTLLDRLDDREAREWYAREAVAGGWSRSVLEDRIRGRLHERVGGAPSNFSQRLPAGEGDLAQAITRDPVRLDFLRLDGPPRERDLEQAMVDQLTRTMLELGDGMAFVGRQVPVAVDDHEYAIDLLFFHIEQLRYVVVELKTGSFDPRDAGQLGFYVNVIEAQRRDPARHAPTVGLLLCSDRSETVVRYSLAGIQSPMAVVSCTYDTLPADVRPSVPSEARLAHDMEDLGSEQFLR